MEIQTIIYEPCVPITKEEQFLVEALQNYVQGLRKYSASQFQFIRLNGNTNATYRALIDCPESPNGQVSIIIRKQGKTSHNFLLNREIQKQICFQANEEKIGPTLYYWDESIKIQEYLEAKTLNFTQVLQPKYIPDIAFSLRRFHEVEIQQEKDTVFHKIFFKRKEQIVTRLSKKIDLNPSKLENQIIEKLKKWVITDELQFLEQKFNHYVQNQDIVLCHNDLIANNIMMKWNQDPHRDASNAVIIDYQYGRYNFFLFDIVNFFTESEIDYDYPIYPYFEIEDKNMNKEQHKLNFIKCYCLAKQKNYKSYKERVSKLPSISDAQTQDQYMKILKKSYFAEMLAHLYWGWKYVDSTTNSDMKINYMLLAEFRMKKYYQAKSKLLKTQF